MSDSGGVIGENNPWRWKCGVAPRGRVGMYSYLYNSETGAKCGCAWYDGDKSPTLCELHRQAAERHDGSTVLVPCKELKAMQDEIKELRARVHVAENRLRELFNPKSV